MLILVAIILGFLIGKIRRGSLKGFKARKISLLPLGILGFLLQIGLHFYSYTGGIPIIEPYLEIVNFASYILVLVMLVFNLDDFWVILMAIGFTANFVVIFINGGHMPVAQSVIDMLPTAFGQTITQGINPIYSLMKADSTLLWFLGIYLPLPIPYVPTIMSLYGSVAGVSVGTILSLIGFTGFIQYAMNKKRSIINDDSLDEEDGDEGIFGDEDNVIEGVSTQSDGESSDNSLTAVYKDLAGGAAIRGDRNQEPGVTEIDAETKAINTYYEEPVSVPYSESDFSYSPEIGTETEEIIVRETFENLPEAPTNVISSIEGLEDKNTKILDNIQEAGTFVVGAESKALEAAEMEEIVNSEDTGFFTKKYYEEKLAIEKERLMAQVKEMQIEEVELPKQEPMPIPENDLRIVEGFKLTDLEASFSLQGSQSVQPPIEEEEEDEEFSEEDMMTVWQRLNHEDEKRKAVRRKETIKQISTEPDSLLKGSPYEVGIPFKEIEEVTETVVEKVYGTTNKQKVLNTMDAKQKKDLDSAIEERKKAGYELVELKLDGKNVAFWRKKK